MIVRILLIWLALGTLGAFALGAAIRRNNL